MRQTIRELGSRPGAINENRPSEVPNARPNRFERKCGTVFAGPVDARNAVESMLRPSHGERLEDDGRF
jgi:hypothetical protein